MRIRLMIAAVMAAAGIGMLASPAGARPDLPCEVLLDRLAVRCGPI